MITEEVRLVSGESSKFKYLQKLIKRSSIDIKQSVLLICNSGSMFFFADDIKRYRLGNLSTVKSYNSCFHSSTLPLFLHTQSCSMSLTKFFRE